MSMPPKCVGRLRGGGSHLLLFADIHLQCQRLATRRLDRRSGGVDRPGQLGIGHAALGGNHDVGAIAGRAQGNRQTDAARGAGNEQGFAGKTRSCVHSVDASDEVRRRRARRFTVSGSAAGYRAVRPVAAPDRSVRACAVARCYPAEAVRPAGNPPSWRRRRRFAGRRRHCGAMVSISRSRMLCSKANSTGTGCSGSAGQTSASPRSSPSERTRVRATRKRAPPSATIPSSPSSSRVKIPDACHRADRRRSRGYARLLPIQNQADAEAGAITRALAHQIEITRLEDAQLQLTAGKQHGGQRKQRHFDQWRSGRPCLQCNQCRAPGRSCRRITDVRSVAPQTVDKPARRRLEAAVGHEDHLVSRPAPRRRSASIRASTVGAVRRGPASASMTRPASQGNSGRCRNTTASASASEGASASA